MRIVELIWDLTVADANAVSGNAKSEKKDNQNDESEKKEQNEKGEEDEKYE